MFFKIEVSKSPRPKAGYETRYGTENETQARLLYKGINVGLGYKKRLVAIDGRKRTILAREAS